MAVYKARKNALLGAEWNEKIMSVAQSEACSRRSDGSQLKMSVALLEAYSGSVFWKK
jgi:hypothetical protein